MTEKPRMENRVDEPRTDVVRQVATPDLNPDTLQPTTEPSVPRERVFPRKVLLGWALFALALYFGVRVIGSVIKESAKSAFLSSGATVTKTDNGTIIYTTPKGERIRITRKRPSGDIVITKEPAVTPAPKPEAAKKAVEAPTSSPPATTTPAAPAKR
jgi:hypothetical protein